MSLSNYFKLTYYIYIYKLLYIYIEVYIHVILTIVYTIRHDTNTVLGVNGTHDAAQLDHSASKLQTHPVVLTMMASMEAVKSRTRA